MKWPSIRNLLNENNRDYVIIFILVVISLTDVFHSQLSTYLLKAIDEVTLSIVLLSEVRNLISSSSHLPLIGASSAQAASSLDEVIKYLSWSDMIITGQLLLIKLSKSIIFKLLTILFVIGLLSSVYRSFSIKMLIILLLVNPGLPAYVFLDKTISQEVHLNNGKSLHVEISEVHKKYLEKEKERNKMEVQRDSTQLAKAQKKGKDHVSGLKKLEDKVFDGVSKVTSKIGEGVEEGFTVVKYASSQLIIKAINFMVTVAMQYLLLPFLFFYGMFTLIKHLLAAQIEAAFTHKLLLLLTIGVVFSLASMIFTSSVASANKPSKDTVSTNPISKTNKSSQEVKGLDVSHFQGDIDWKDIAKAGMSFVYCKATEGTTFVDPKFSENWQGAKGAKLVRGAYHFYVAGMDPKNQAELFINTVKMLEAEDLPPVLDLEAGGMKPNIDPENYRKNVLVWLEKVEKALGKKPIIYTDHPYGSKYLTDPKFGSYGLWIADWEKRSSPLIPDVWKGKWLFWQKTETGKVQGALGNVDHDLFNGDLNQLKSLK